jgi:hypothetical protein
VRTPPIRWFPALPYFDGVAAVLPTAAVLLVDFDLELVEFLLPDFLVLLVEVVLLVVAVLVFGAVVGAAGVVWASEAPARAKVIVRPRIVEIVFVIVLFVLLGSSCSVRF